jgi:hypothetical protein
VLIFEQSQLARKFKLDNFPCTRDEWYKYIFWPVHANGGDYPLDLRAVADGKQSPYAEIATAMRAPNRSINSGYRRGGTVYPNVNRQPNRKIKITQELGRSLNQLELREAPRVRLRLKHASLSAYQRVTTPKLKFQYQASTVPTTAPTSAFTSLVPVSSMFTNQRQGNSTQDARTVLSSVRSWSDRRNSSPTPSFDNFVPSFMRDTIITRAAELMSDMQLFATVDVSPQEHDDSESAGGPNRENTAELTQRRDEPASRWRRSSHTSARVHALLDHDHNASTNNDDTSDRSESRGIRFGLSPSAVFDRAENHGSYREFENRNDEGVQRGFDFRLDANRGNNHSSATPSDCNDDYNSSNGGNNHSSATPSDCNDDYNSSNDEDEDHSSTGNSH